MLAVGLLPYVPVSDGREAWTAASNSSATVGSLNRDVRCCRELVMFCTLSSLGISKHRYCSDHCHQHGEAKKHLLHNLIHCSVSCATSNVIIDCLSVYVQQDSYVTTLSYFFAFCRASSARRIYDLALERASSAFRLVSSALSIAFRALRRELRACSYCF